MDQFMRDYKNHFINSIEVFKDEQLTDMLNADTSYFSIFHNNIRSVNEHFDEFEACLSDYQEFCSCIILTETWNKTANGFFNLKKLRNDSQ